MDSSTRKNWCIAIFLGGLAIGCGSLVALTVQDGMRSMQSKQTRNDLRWISLALDQYHDKYGCFPPVVGRDLHGEPFHSWRSLLQRHLPSIVDTRDNFMSYDFSKPWDSPENEASSRQHRFGAHPFQFLAIVGTEAAWPPEGVRQRDELRDGNRNPALVIATRGTGVRWHEPYDAVVTDSGILTVNGNPLDLSGEVFVLLASGEVSRVDGISPGALLDLISIDRDETVLEQ